MNVVSVTVGKPKVILSENESIVTSGIYKSPVAGPVKVGQFNLEGDQQADLTVHGGWSKAVYVYPYEHYELWAAEIPELTFSNGFFGENLTTEGLLETGVFIGDKLRIGTAEFVVTEPRMPCYKLGIRAGRKDFLRLFLQSGRSGFYLAVEKTGELQAGDEIEILQRDENRVSVSDIVRLYVRDKHDTETMRRAIRSDVLPEGWKESFRKILDRPATSE